MHKMLHKMLQNGNIGNRNRTYMVVIINNAIELLIMLIIMVITSSTGFKHSMKLLQITIICCTKSSFTVWIPESQSAATLK